MWSGRACNCSGEDMCHQNPSICPCFVGPFYDVFFPRRRYENEVKDAIECATPEGLRSLEALKDRMLSLESAATTRRDDFIRSQPAWAGDQAAGRHSLLSGYLIWAYSVGKWWPAQIYTPLTYTFRRSFAAYHTTKPPQLIKTHSDCLN